MTSSMKVTSHIKRFFLGDLSLLASDPLKTLACAAQERSVTRYRLAWLRTYYISDKKIIRELMADENKNLDKWTLSWRVISNVIGKSLLVSSGKSWRKQRQIATPAFQPQKIEELSPVFVETARECANRWDQAATNNTRINLAREMMSTTLVATTRTLFGSDVDARTCRDLTARIPGLLQSLSKRITTGGLPLWLPTTKNREFKDEMRPVVDIIKKIVQSKRKELNESKTNSTDRKSLITTLILATDQGPQDSLSDRQLCDEVIGYFFAGHETTAVALTWLWVLLNKNTDTLDEIRTEILNEVGHRDPKYTDLPKLKKLNSALLESLRLYPPVWLIERRATKKLNIRSLRLKKNDIVFFSTYILHRDPDIWENPERFIPARFDGDWRSRIDRYSYMPFGAGPRTCIGLSFAMVEMQLIMAYLIPRYNICIEDIDQIQPSPHVSLKTNKEIHVKASKLID